jgi:uncharacterized protein YaaN involved in tellurite resistance
MNFKLETANISDLKIEVAEDINKNSTVQKISSHPLTAENIKNFNINSLEERQMILKFVENFGMDTMFKSANKSASAQSQILGVNQIWGESSSIVNNLNSLEFEMKKLDPSSIDFNPKGLFKKMFNPIKNYFELYTKADASINSIIVSLEKGRSILKNDNTTLELEEVSLRELTLNLANEIKTAEFIIKELEDVLSNYISLNISDDKIKFVKEEVYEPLTQRLFDLNQLMVVNQQGILTISVLRRNNKELIRGIDRARTITLAALKTAVTVAQSLYNQKLVLKKVETLNKMSTNIIQGTSAMMNNQSGEIFNKTMNSSVSVDSLRTAFEETFQTIETINSYKNQAIENIKDTTEKFRILANENEEKIKNLENNNI